MATRALVHRHSTKVPLLGDEGEDSGWLPLASGRSGSLQYALRTSNLKHRHGAAKPHYRQSRFTLIRANQTRHLRGLFRRRNSLPRYSLSGLWRVPLVRW